MGQGFDAVLVADPRQQLAQRRVAGEFERQVADEVRQFVAGVDAFEVRRAVEVVAGVDEPVGVEDDEGVHAQGFAAAGDFVVAVDGILSRALARAVELAQVHGRDVCDFGDQGQCSHGLSPLLVLLCCADEVRAFVGGKTPHTPQCGMWCEPSDTATFFGSRKTS